MDILSQRLEMDRHSINKKFKIFWQYTYQEARDIFYVKPTLKLLIKKGLTYTEIADFLLIHKKSLDRLIKRFWNLTLREARKKFDGTGIFERRISIILKESLKGKKPHNYIEISRELLDYLIKLGLTRGEISKTLGISEETVQRKIKEIWGSDMTLSILQDIFLKSILDSLLKRSFTHSQIGSRLNKSKQEIMFEIEEFSEDNFLDGI